MSYRAAIQQVEALKLQALKLQSRRQSTACPTNIIDYAKFRGITLTEDQIRVLNSVLTNRPVIVESAHSVGKSLLAALLCCWFFDTHQNAIGLVTAPTNRQIGEIIFKEMRRIKGFCKEFAPKANRLERNAMHWVHGFSPQNGDSFQGKHSPGGILIVFDEAAGVENTFYERAHSMFESGKANHYFLAIGNPYNKSSPMYLESLTGRYIVERMSALNHPNVVHKREVIAGAITYQTVKERLDLDCRPADQHELDKSFKFENKNYISQNPLFDVQILGRYPAQSDFSLYSEQDLENLTQPLKDDPSYLVAIGCDVARYGSCSTVFTVRRGPNIIELVSVKGYSILQTANKLKELCNKYGTKSLPPTKIPCQIDGSGLGAGVIDLKGTGTSTYNFIEVINNKKASEDIETYVNGKRSEIWVRARDLARQKRLSIAMLPKMQQEALLMELRMPEFVVNNASQIVLESKEKIIKRLGKSPDLADSFGLACLLPQPTFERV